MRCLVPLLEERLARGKAVHVLLDISKAGGSYVTVVSQDRIVIAMDVFDAYEEAYEAGFAISLAFVQDTGLKAVLARCMGSEGGRDGNRPAYGAWEMSYAAYAARHFKIGTWEWVKELVEHRRTCTELGIPHT
jgi:hypothetical protein